MVKVTNFDKTFEDLIYKCSFQLEVLLDEDFDEGSECNVVLADVVLSTLKSTYEQIMLTKSMKTGVLK